jgi:hypothetical protein
MEEKFTVPSDSFFFEWESVGVSMFTEIVDKELSRRRSRWNRFAGVYSVGARKYQKLLDCRWKSLKIG